MLHFKNVKYLFIYKYKYLNTCVRNLTFSFVQRNGEFASKYVPQEVENGKYKKWEKHHQKSSSIIKNKNKQFKTILPPPNITGNLHLGHALTLTIQDVLLRWNKMCGKETLWIPGIDHAGIATQVIVEKKIWGEQRKTRHDVGREQFEKEIWKWKEQKADFIRQQIKKLGALPDWEREFFTMDERQSKAVTAAFIKLFDSGLIYRADHLINWSCALQSAISDIEVEYLELPGRTPLQVPGYKDPIEFGTMTKFAYKLCDTDDEVIVCTTRPETIPGDVALAVHSADERYCHLHGKHVLHPFRNEQIPIICDDFVNPDFGTGVVKITPAHDPVDFEVGKRHSFKPLQVINEKGFMVDCCDNTFHGLKRFEARKIIVKKLEEKRLLRSIDDHPMTVPICSRSKDVIEYLIKPQWFISCKKMAERACMDVKTGKLKIDPPVFEKVWFNWLENIRDWCISRQLWWGHRIPVYECHISNATETKIWTAAKNIEEAKMKVASKLKSRSENIIAIQENDVLDTWFSSGLLPFSVFGWPEKNEDFQRNYPLSLLETGHDILFFWVARMVMLGTELTGQLPFNRVLLHGIICDAQGRKMSKSLGNIVNPEDVISGISLENLSLQAYKAHESGFLSATELEKSVSGQNKMFPDGIPECGADALRFTLCSHNIKTHFINFDVQECYTNKLFCNKIWQACRYTHMCMEKIKDSVELSALFSPSFMDQWILSRLSYMVTEVNSALEREDFHMATASLKQFLYSEFCDVYVEATKTEFRKLNINKAASHLAVLLQCLDIGLRCIAPFMPFVADELYQHLPKHPVIEKLSSIIDASYPQNFGQRNESIENEVEMLLEAIIVMRRLRKLYNISYKNKRKAYIISSIRVFHNNTDVLKSLSNFNEIIVTSEAMEFKLPTVSDTVGNYGIVHLEVPEAMIKKVGDEQNHFNIKINKLTEKIEKMEKMTSQEGYKQSAPLRVQESHLKQLTSLKEELHQLQRLHQSV